MKKFYIFLLLLIFAPLFINYGYTEETEEIPSVIYDHGEMILIHEGEFIMGSSDEEISLLAVETGKSPDYFHHETPKHKVYLKSYYIDKYEVTNGQFLEFIEAGGYEDYSYWTEDGWNWKEKKAYQEPKWWLSGQYHSGPHNPGYPVIGVSWYEAYAYAKWAGKRLPTEAEWEKAARGTEGFIYPWGMEWDEEKCSSMGQDISPAGSFPEGLSTYGVMDMAGNVWEWCQDWYFSDYYYSSPPKNPQGPEEGGYKVIKGGCGGNAYFYYFRCANRNKGEINYWDNYTGFRCVKDI